MSTLTHALFDNDDEEIVATFTDAPTLKDAVTRFLKHRGDWGDTPYYSDGFTGLTAQQFVNSPRLLDEAFKLVPLPAPLT